MQISLLWIVFYAYQDKWMYLLARTHMSRLEQRVINTKNVHVCVILDMFGLLNNSLIRVVRTNLFYLASNCVVL